MRHGRASRAPVRRPDPRRANRWCDQRLAPEAAASGELVLPLMLPLVVPLMVPLVVPLVDGGVVVLELVVPLPEVPVPEPLIEPVEPVPLPPLVVPPAGGVVVVLVELELRVSAGSRWPQAERAAAAATREARVSVLKGVIDSLLDTKGRKGLSRWQAACP
jgi:hypothetical protein